VKPTQEQQAILNSTGRALLINARAGTGKTTTLRMIAHSPRPKPSRTELRGFSATRSAPSPPKAPEPKAPRKKPFKVGDRVRTSHGTGTVVEVDGDKYLVDLDGQGAKLWTREWAFRKA
jgi:hypothetical protein